MILAWSSLIFYTKNWPEQLAKVIFDWTFVDYCHPPLFLEIEVDSAFMSLVNTVLSLFFLNYGTRFNLALKKQGTGA